MSYKICMALFAVEENEDVQKWTKFSSGNTSILVPTLMFKGSSDDIKDQLNEACEKLVSQIEE